MVQGRKALNPVQRIYKLWPLEMPKLLAINCLQKLGEGMELNCQEKVCGSTDHKKYKKTYQNFLV